MKVPLIDLQAQYAPIKDAVRLAVDRVFETQQFVMGPEVAALETEVAAYCQTKEAIGCASGSDALLLALMALNVGPGDEVITTPFSFFATGSAIARLGARPVFVDIDPLTYNLDVDQIAAAITARTRVVLPVHLYGQCADMDQILALCKSKNVVVLEDAAQAIGAEDRGRRAGSMGIAGCFSFYPSKNLGAAGDAGIITTSDPDFSARVRRLRVHGGLTEYQHIEVGLNSRIDALQAAVLRAKLPHLDGWSNARAQKAQNYSHLLEGAKLNFKLDPPFIKPEQPSHLSSIRRSSSRASRRADGTFESARRRDQDLLSDSVALTGVLRIPGLQRRRVSGSREGRARNFCSPAVSRTHCGATGIRRPLNPGL